jgi:hypothetical protein
MDQATINIGKKKKEKNPSHADLSTMLIAFGRVP